jgi:hypothetical protein
LQPDFPCRSHVAHFQLRTNAEQYQLLETLHPEVAANCTMETLLAYRPFYVVRPHRRTCVCTYHNEMKLAVEDARAAYAQLHLRCGEDGGGCGCDYCKDGACKKDDAFESYHALSSKRLCCGEDGKPLEKRECVKGLCNDCGFKEAVEVECVRSAKGVGVVVDGDMYVTRVVPSSAAAKAKVQLGWRVVAVQRLNNGDDGDESLMETVSCKTGLAGATGKRRGENKDAKALVRFQTLEFKPAFARCPLVGQADAEIDYRCYGEQEQKRAKARFSVDGEETTTRMVKMIVVETTTHDAFLRRLCELSDAFVEHNYIAHNQAASYDKCVDKVPWDSVVLLMDFSMNYGHEHQDSGQQEWWSSWQTTLLPVVAYRRVPEFEGDETGVVVAESRVYVSPDLLHSNAFVQHVTNDSIRHYQRVFAAGGTPLVNVHIWSDGCRGQFKNKEQFLWLTSGTTFATPPPTDTAGVGYGRLRLAHHFFQSCHGKGPSDSEGAAVKCSLRRYELLGRYFADTDAAYKWLEEHLTKVC